MNLTKEIESAERKFRQKLEDFFTYKWGKTKLYSHDINHHRRVWDNARSLLNEVYARFPDKIHFSPDKLLTACYVHDLGMVVETGDKHGIQSSRLFREFLELNKLPESCFSEAIEAVENHDKKESASIPVIFSIATFLAAADDLDAFGYIGIYRYIEIYLERGIHPDNLGYEIINNAQKRFANFELLFAGFKELIEKHKERYLILYKFFNEYNREICSRT
jgi:HD superfamily phosphodiesterase